MRVFIAGADGFIGNYLFNSFDPLHRVNASGYYNNNLKNCYFGDLSNKNTSINIVRKIAQPDVLIFLVGLAHKKGKNADYSLFEDVNYNTLMNLLNAFQNDDKLPEKIIFASTVSVYGERKNISIYNESIETKPYSPYAITKLMAEKYLLTYFPEKSWILRFAPVYSPTFMLNINRRTNIRNFHYKVGNGMQRLSLCNLSNIRKAIEGIINGKVPYGIYNISDEIDYSYNTLLDSIKVENVVRIPIFIPYLAFFLGAASKNIFIRENSLKLLKDNIFPSAKIRHYIDLPHKLEDLKN